MTGSFAVAFLSPSKGGLSSFLLTAGANEDVSARQSPSYSGQIIFLLAACVAILFITYYLTKYIQRARYSSSGKGVLGVSEVIGVGVNSTVQLIRAANKYVLIGVTRDRIVYLTELPEEEVESRIAPAPDFKGAFDKYMQRFAGKGKDAETEKESALMRDSGDGNENVD